MRLQVFGETATEMAEVYFYYGKSLLELARLESGVLGNALDGGELDINLESLGGMGAFLA
jgi:hypothetical protein